MCQTVSESATPQSLNRTWLGVHVWLGEPWGCSDCDLSAAHAECEVLAVALPPCCMRKIFCD